MSSAGVVRAARATARAGAGRPAAVPRPGLRIVSSPEHLRSRASLVAACLALLGVGLVGLLVLTVSLGRGAYEMGELRRTTTELTEQRQALQEQIAAEQAPQALAARARSLGMVPAPNVAMIRSSDGVVLGAPKAAAGQPLMAPRHPLQSVPSASAKASAKPSTAPSAMPSPSATAKPAAKPTTTSAAKPAVKPAVKPAAKPAVKPTIKPAAKPSPTR
ncbi:MAG: hypothetical protein WAL50_17605 [Kineosporiaceae bacterium]